MPGVGIDSSDPDGKLDAITRRLIRFAPYGADRTDIHWAMAQWISDMAYGWQIARFPGWEMRFVHCLIDVAELGDVLSQ